MPKTGGNADYREQLIRLTQALVRIPSQYVDGVMAQHDQVTSFLAEHMQSIGLDVSVVEGVPGFPVVVGATPGGADGPVYGIIGHYSTVAIGNPREWSQDPLGGDLVGDRLYGRGASDAKGGIAAVLTATQSLMESGLERKGQLRLLMVPGEGCTETALAPIMQDPDGAQALKCDIYIDSDGGPDRLTPLYGGWTWLEFTTRGKGGHAGILTSDGSIPVNPLSQLIDVLSALKKEQWMAAEHHPLFHPSYGERYSPDPIVDINVVRAGTQVNKIPFEASAQVDLRLLPGQRVKQVLEELNALLDRCRATDPHLDIAYRVIGVSKNERQVPMDHPIVKQIVRTCQEVGEPKPHICGSNWGGRASLAAVAPVIGFGACEYRNAHAPDEYAEVDELIRGARIHAQLYANLLCSEENRAAQA